MIGKILTLGIAPLAASSLITAPTLPIEPWAQLGVAGLSLFVLLWVMTRTVPRMMRDIAASHERSAKVQARATIAATRSSNARIERLTEAVESNTERQLDVLTKSLGGPK